MIRIFLNQPVLVLDDATGQVGRQSVCVTLLENQEYEIKDGVLTIYKNPGDTSKAYKFNWDKVIYLELTPPTLSVKR